MTLPHDPTAAAASPATSRDPSPLDYERQIRDLKLQLERVRRSRTMRIGRAITAPYRSLRSWGGRVRGRERSTASDVTPDKQPWNPSPERARSRAGQREGQAAAADGLPIALLRGTVDVAPGTAIELEVHSVCLDPGVQRAGLVTIEFRSPTGEVVLPMGDLPMHAGLGMYFYLDERHGVPSRTTARFEVPPDAVSFSYKGVQWKNDNPVHVLERPRLTMRSRGGTRVRENDGVAEFIRSIPADARLVVLDTTAPPLGHQTLSLRPNRLAAEYESLGAWVIFFPFGSLQDQDSHVSGRIRQFPRSEFEHFVNAALECRALNKTYVCSSFPNMHAVAAMDTLKAAGWRIVYEVRDDMEEFNRVGFSKWFRPALEARAVAAADTVVTVSPRLARKMDIIANAQNRAIVVPNAVAGALVQEARLIRRGRVEHQSARQAKVGYVGHLTPAWFDWNKVLRLAERMPHAVFEIVGHGLPDHLVLPENVVYLGHKTHDELLEIVPDWRVGLIPFVPSPLTFGVDPNKIYEYLAFGLRTVTADMGAVRSCPSTWVYSSVEELERFVGEALRSPFTAEELAEMEQFLTRSTWRHRAETMLELMQVLP
jgi:glycosyltransferase involved in cell wall biosynthesis